MLAETAATEGTFPATFPAMRAPTAMFVSSRIGSMAESATLAVGAKVAAAKAKGHDG